MASTLYILLPSKAVAQASPEWVRLARPFALVSDEGNILQHGSQALFDLKELAANARQISLLLAASDVSLISVQVPPMSAAKLKQALPNLLEEQLLGDPAELILLASPVHDGMCTIAAVDKAWMEFLHEKMQVLGPRKLTAYALSMSMRTEPGATTVIVDEDLHATQLAVRLDKQNGFGLTLAGDAQANPHDVATQVLQTLPVFATAAKVQVAVSARHLAAFQQAASQAAPQAAPEEDAQDGSTEYFFEALDWTTRIAGLNPSTLDLMSSVSHANQSSFDWARWRWPLGLAAAVLVVNLAALNFQWLSMQREARALSDSLTQTYRSSFPKESVILDPLAQMQQKINLGRKAAGLSTPDDFLVLAAQFGQVWDRVTAGKPGGPAVVSMEYREHSLFIKLKSSAQLPLDQFKAALQEYALVLVSSSDGVLQVRPGPGDNK